AVALPNPQKAKQRFMNFLAAEAQSADTRIIRPPFLNSNSKASDFESWIGRVAMPSDEDFEELFVKPLDTDADCLTMFVCVKHEIAPETHLDSIEKFLVLEGTCKIDIEGEIFYLQAGDYLSIPKFKEHTVYVTSSMPCRLIVQQIAA
ncbi:MAG: hypothetical protein RLZZ519_36, partial [Bacteroidota bacterium]